MYYIKFDTKTRKFVIANPTTFQLQHEICTRTGEYEEIESTKIYADLEDAKIEAKWMNENLDLNSTYNEILEKGERYSYITRIEYKPKPKPLDFWDMIDIIIDNGVPIIITLVILWWIIKTLTKNL